MPGSSRPTRGFPARRIADAAIGLAVFLGGFVIFEPAPYELFLCLLLALWVLFGMRIPRPVMPLLVLFCLFNAGGVISSFQVEDWQSGIIYVAVSFFLALSSVFFAIVVYGDMTRLRLIFRAYVVAAAITTTLGIIGYFGALPGFDMFTRYSRAMGAFQDPNVFAPFLVAPSLYLIYGIVNRSASMVPVRVGLLMLLQMGLFLAFSRAAWGLFVLCAMLFYLLLIINEPSAKTRLKYIVLAVLGFVVVALMLMVALQFDAVADLFKERFKVVQEYDAGRMGRFARIVAGYELALTRPLGIGPLQFGPIFGEDTHNNFVKALMDYGWLGFASWIAINLWTLVAGFKLLFRPRPWLPYFQIAYVVFLGHFVIGNVIDTDHWRHFYLMVGLVWGCIALEKRWQRERGASGARISGARMPAAALATRQAAMTRRPPAAARGRTIR